MTEQEDGVDESISLMKELSSVSTVEIREEVKKHKFIRGFSLYESDEEVFVINCD